MRHSIDRLTLLLLFFLCSNVGVGQINFEESNWFKEIGRYDDWYSRFDLTRYTKEDVEKAKAKFLRIAAAKSMDEWSGSYRRETMLGRAEITWDRDEGFVCAYVYHTLANLNYGRIKLSGESIIFVSERSGATRRSSLEPEYIRVMLGERHLLVPKNRLAEFAVWAAGREVPTGQRAKEIYTEDGFFWEKIGDSDKEIADIPTFPAAYARLIRKPIKLRVSTVGKRQIKREKGDGWSREEHTFRLRLSGGRKQGVRVGMRFWVDDLEEWIEVTSAAVDHSFALLSRPFIDGREYCDRYQNYTQIEFPCRDIRVGMTSRTRVDYW